MWKGPLQIVDKHRPSKMASLSLEDENYVRMSLLLSRICPRAARVLFDKEFPPADLGATLNKESKKLRDLKMKRIINQQQWNLLFPSHPGKYRYKN